MKKLAKFSKNRLIGRGITRLALEREITGSNLGSVEPDTALLTNSLPNLQPFFKRSNNLKMGRKSISRFGVYAVITVLNCKRAE